jgi:hypothetical protein
MRLSLTLEELSLYKSFWQDLVVDVDTYIKNSRAEKETYELGVVLPGVAAQLANQQRGTGISQRLTSSELL